MQTISFLIKRFREAGLRPVTTYGQNFLIDMNLLQLLADRAELTKDDVALEVGGGTGALTSLLADAAGWVVSVEIDEHLHQLAREELTNHSNVTILLQDVLRNKNAIHSNVMESVQQAIQETPAKQFKLAANLPYNIATPLISNLLSTEITPASMTVTIQKELADRIVARPNCKDYSALSIWIQAQCDAEIVRVLPPTVFWPRPKVHSAIVHIAPNQQKRDQITDHKFFHSFVRAMFFHRRKFLRSVVASAFKNQLEKPDVDAILGEMNLERETRAEQLDVHTMLALADAVKHRLEQ